jgi:aldose 1-epimerase
MSEISVYKLMNKSGMEVDVLNLGARVSAIRLPVAGQLQEMTMTYEDVNKFTNDPFYIGATVGRVCNRIAKGQFTLNDKIYTLPVNNGENCLHGGDVGFSFFIWQVEQQTNNSITLSLISPDGDQGFPGELATTICYTLTDDNTLNMQFKASSDQDTVVNLCNHCYLNLGEENIDSLNLVIKSNHVLLLDQYNIPKGDLTPVKNTDFDFNQVANMKERISSLTHPDLSQDEGIDHCYVLDTDDDIVAELSSSKVKLSIRTDQPALQLYTAAYLSEPFTAFQSLCLEAQNFIDAINQPNFPSAVLKQGDTYEQFVSYQFTCL